MTPGVRHRSLLAAGRFQDRHDGLHLARVVERPPGGAQAFLPPHPHVVGIVVNFHAHLFQLLLLLGAQAQLSYSQIRSPIDGVVTDRPLYPGELASANQPLLTVMNTSRLIAKAHISQAQAARLSKGNPASIQIAGQEDAIPAKLSLISPALDPGSTTIEVWIEASKPPAALRPGMTVQISITARTAKNAVLVPTNSVLQTPDGASYVMIAGSEGVAHQKNVQLGIHGITETQVTSGLAAGDSVIISGGYGLPDKTKIKIEASPASEEGASKSGEKPPSSGSEKE